MTAINDSPEEAVIHPLKGLLHSPYPAQWDSDTEIYGPDWRSRTGHTAGWWWATDSFTCCGVKDGEEYDEDEADQTTTAAKVVEYLTADLTAPLWAVEPRHLAIIGGLGHLRDWGVWDLDRVCDAASWVIGDSGNRIVVAVDKGLHALRLVSPSGRVAVVMGVRPGDDAWFPVIDLPVQDAVAEAIANGLAIAPGSSDQNGRTASARCASCGFVQDELNWCQRCGHRTVWARDDGSEVSP